MVIMATTTRVPFVSATTSFANQCHKYSLVARTIHLPVSSESLRLSSCYSSSLVSLALPRSFKGVKRGGNRRSVIVAMAESSKSTVLVTGAGGRTGLVFFVVWFDGFCLNSVFFLERDRVFWTRKWHFMFCFCFLILLLKCVKP